MNEFIFMPLWSENAACKGRDVDPELFFPTQTASHAARGAKEICHVCPVKMECLQWAFETEDEHAVLGGTTPRERHRMLKEMRKRRLAKAG